MFRVDNQAKQVSLIDYSFAYYYDRHLSLLNLPLETNQHFLGTLKYTSLNTHLGLSMDICFNIFPN